MELEDLKNTWLALDKKLEADNSLNDRIIKEMLQTKSSKSIGRLLGYEIFGVCVLLLILPFIVYLYLNYVHITQLLAGSIFLISMFVLIILLIIWQSIKIFVLSKIDLSYKVIENIRRTNQYNIFIKREKFASSFLLPVIAIFCFYYYIEVKAPVIAWITMSCIFVIAVIYTIWSYKRIYDKNIKNLLNSLEELKDLEEE